MKRIFDSSKTISHSLARSNSKSRRPYSRDFVSNGRKPSKLQNLAITNAKRHVSVSTGLDEPADLDVSRHNMPEKLNWYWNLDEDHKRKITDPTYVRQAVQDTFMQRAHGGYHYKKSGQARNSSSAISSQSSIQPKPEVSMKSPAKTKQPKLPPPSVEKMVPKPQPPKRKRIIETAKPLQSYLRPRPYPEQRRVRSGANLKEAGQKQLEEAKKKLYDPAPAVLDYLTEKHVPKTSGLQLRGRKDKPEVPQFPPLPSLMQRVFGWKGKDEPKKNDTDISITPRSIEVRKKSAKAPVQKLLKNTNTLEVAGKSRKKKSAGKLRLSLRRSAKKQTPGAEKRSRKTTQEVEEKSARQAQAEEDREAIWSKMKASSAQVSQTTQEVTSVRKQVRDLELTPQIYPKGSLSMRKSYLPITACRPKSDLGRPTESHSSVYAMRREQETPQPVKESPSITSNILESLRSILSRIRRNSA